MTDVEARFLDEYKMVDAFCKRVCGGEKGVTDYLNTMKEYFPYGERVLPNWKRDYEAIKRLRYIRNLIGHEVGDSGCREADYLELQKLHLRFLRREDPLALLKKAEYNAEKAAEGQRAAADAAFAAAPQQTLRRKAKGQSALRMAAVILLLFVMALAAAGIAVIIFMFA